MSSIINNCLTGIYTVMDSLCTHLPPTSNYIGTAIYDVGHHKYAPALSILTSAVALYYGGKSLKKSWNCKRITFESIDDNVKKESTEAQQRINLPLQKPVVIDYVAQQIPPEVANDPVQKNIWLCNQLANYPEITEEAKQIQRKHSNNNPQATIEIANLVKRALEKRYSTRNPPDTSLRFNIPTVKGQLVINAKEISNSLREASWGASQVGFGIAQIAGVWLSIEKKSTVNKTIEATGLSLGETTSKWSAELIPLVLRVIGASLGAIAPYSPQLASTSLLCIGCGLLGSIKFKYIDPKKYTIPQRPTQPPQQPPVLLQPLQPPVLLQPVQPLVPLQPLQQPVPLQPVQPLVPLQPLQQPVPLQPPPTWGDTVVSTWNTFEYRVLITDILKLLGGLACFAAATSSLSGYKIYLANGKK
jgi:hypothetical protein